MNKSESIKEISKALFLAQQEMKDAVKGSENPFFKSKFADLNSVREAVMPALAKNKITVLQPVNGEYVDTVLLHESGEYIGSSAKIVMKNANDPQQQGIAISYARRYALQSMLCIGAVDDDAESIMERSGNQSKPVPSYKSNGFKSRYGNKNG